MLPVSDLSGLSTNWRPELSHELKYGGLFISTDCSVSWRRAADVCFVTTDLRPNDRPRVLASWEAESSGYMDTSLGWYDSPPSVTDKATPPSESEQKLLRWGGMEAGARLLMSTSRSELTPKAPSRATAVENLEQLTVCEGAVDYEVEEQWARVSKSSRATTKRKAGLRLYRC
jgi:hypothetical protein